MSTSNFDETYMGRDILVSYLQQHQDKSWTNLDSSWLSRFLDEAKRLNQDNFTALNGKSFEQVKVNSGLTVFKKTDFRYEN
uniref:Uncharacterized protein n=1 Tax=Rhizophagus irregularis (strain DAOM 181602 / DAOM 197198 / MUCL 43194) TaxID=747089 RepID=U9U1P7_RHIID